MRLYKKRAGEKLVKGNRHVFRFMAGMNWIL